MRTHATLSSLVLAGLLGLMLPPTASAAAGCSELDGWNTGRQGQDASTECGESAYAEAYRLGEALADLQAKRAAVAGEIKAGTADDIGALRRRQRQLDVDIEAIHGVATLRGWPVEVSNRPQAQGESR